MKKLCLHVYIILSLITLTFINCGGDSGEEEIKSELKTTNIETFNKTHLSFGDGGIQTAKGTFQFLSDNSNVEQILMYVKLDCPTGGCGAWDVFANIKVKDKESENWYELGRYITPYGVDNSQRPKGFIFDVTDFKSILKGSVELKSFVEVWTKEGWLISVDFKIKEGNPTYKYSAIIPLIDYAKNSQQIPYGEPLPTDLLLNGQVTIPTNAKKTKLRSVISGWGHATPNDSDGRPSAEWGFRSHSLNFGDKLFTHEMGPIGCNSNPVNPQYGNWEPDRAGWCPGQEVPIRFNTPEKSSGGETLDFSYDFENWTNNNENGKAYYSLSTYLIVQSHSPIQKPVVH